VHVGGLSLPVVFIAGIVSFASPCVLPLVPGYVSVITGGAGADPRRIMRASAVFLSGFLLMFIALGASASYVGSLLGTHRLWLDRAAGVLIIAFGLSLLGVGWSGTLGGRWQQTVHGLGRRGTFVLGLAFALAWTPCVGPYLAAILNLAAVSEHLRTGALLLLVYGLGLALPFLAVAFGFGRALRLLRVLQNHHRAIETVSGVLLVVMGALLLTGRLGQLNADAQRLLDAVGLDWWSSI
jgi:cytochrome c-type biogenesis protein